MREIFDIVARVNAEEGVTVLVVEQNARVALSIAHYGYIMESGRIVLEGDRAYLLENPDVQEFYLGVAKEGGGRASRRSRPTSGASASCEPKGPCASGAWRRK